MKTLKGWIAVSAVGGVMLAVVLAATIHTAFAQGTKTGEAVTAAMTEVSSRYYMAVVVGAALAAGFGFLGGGFAVAKVGAAALGAASERPELLIRSLVFVALGEGIAIFGLVVAILLILKLP